MAQYLITKDLDGESTYLLVRFVKALRYLVTAHFRPAVLHRLNCECNGLRR